MYIDSTTVAAHRHSAGACPAQSEQAIGTARGGRGTKVHAVCGALGYPMAVELTGAQASDVTHARTMLEDQQAERIVAGRGCGCDRLREQIVVQGAEPVIPGRKNRKVPVEYDKHWYKSRHLVENFFCRIADHRRVATRYEKTASRFLATVLLSCILVWLKF